MGSWLRIFLAAGALAWAGGVSGANRLEEALLRAVMDHPGETNFQTMIPQIQSLPPGPRLELALRLCKLRPEVDAFQLVLADAYGAAGNQRMLSAALQAAMRARPKNLAFREEAAAAMARWGLNAQAASTMEWSIDASSDPARYLPSHALMVEYSRGLPDGGPERRLKQQCQRRVGSGTAELKPWLLLEQSFSLEGNRRSLAELCRAALTRFPGERRFYDGLALTLEKTGDAAGLVLLRRRQVESLPAIISSDYVALAHALLLAGKPKEARQALADGEADNRLSPADKRVLEDRGGAMDALKDAINAWMPADAGCAFRDTSRVVSVSCSGKSLSYDYASGSFQPSANSAEAARLAAAMLDYFGRERFADADKETAVLSDDVRARLNEAGYTVPSKSAPKD